MVTIDDMQENIVAVPIKGLLFFTAEKNRTAVVNAIPMKMHRSP